MLVEGLICDLYQVFQVILTEDDCTKNTAYFITLSIYDEYFVTLSILLCSVFYYMEFFILLVSSSSSLGTLTHGRGDPPPRQEVGASQLPAWLSFTSLSYVL